MTDSIQWEAEFEAEASREKIASYAQVLPYLVAGSLAAGVGIVFLTWDDSNHPRILIWFLVFFLHALYRFYRYSVFRKDPKKIDLKRERAEQIASGVINGSLWGWFAFLAGDIPLDIQLLVYFLIASFCGMGAMVAGSNPVAYGAYVICSLAPLQAFLISSGGRYNLTIASFVVVAAWVVYIIARKNYLATNALFRLKVERQLIAQKLEATNEQLKQANEAKSRLIQAASHDLRQPVYGMTLMFDKMIGRCRDHNDTLKERCPVMKTGKEVLEIESALHYLSQSLNNLLDLSRLEAGAISAKQRPVSLDELFSRLALELSPQAIEKDINLRVRATHATVAADHALLHSVLSNLIANAITYTDRGSVLVAARRRGQYFRIYVMDQGIGMSPELVESRKVFGEFYRASQMQKNGTNAGLGLAIAERFAGAMGSHIQLSSHEKTGSCFYLDLPACAPSTEPRTSILLPGGGAVRGFAGTMAMVVTKPENSPNWIAKLLEENEACTARCSSLQDAFLWAQGVGRGIIVIDLPELHDPPSEQAWNLVRRIKELPEPFLIIVLVAHLDAKQLPFKGMEDCRLIDKTSLSPLKLKAILTREFCRKLASLPHRNDVCH